MIHGRFFICLLLKAFSVGFFRRRFYCLHLPLASFQRQAPPGELQVSFPAHAKFVICDCTIERLVKAMKQLLPLVQLRSDQPPLIRTTLLAWVLAWSWQEEAVQ